MKIIDQKALSRKLAISSHLPSIPQVLLTIKQVTENPNSSAVELANCILSDHQLTSRILRMANSVHYGEFSGKITTVTQAIVLMGFRAVHNIAISMAVFEVVNKISRDSKFDVTAFWTRSLACGIISKYLVNQIRKPKLVEAAFIAGFMHDIGQAILAAVFPKQYEPIVELDMERLDIYKSERAILGTDHMVAGEMVARQWNLPFSLIKVIANHHRIGMAENDKSSELLVDVVYLSDLFYPHVMTGSPADAKTYSAIAEQSVELLEFSHNATDNLVEQCRQEVTEIAADFEIDIDTELDKCALREEDVVVLHNELSNKEVQLAFLQNAATALMQAKSDDEILQIICEAVYRGLHMGRVLMFEFDAKWDSFVGKVGFGIESQDDVKSLSFSSLRGLFRDLKTNKSPVSVVGDDEEIQGKLLTPEEIEVLQISSYAALPLTIIGEVKYVLLVDGHDRKVPMKDKTLRSIESLVNQGAMTLERNLYREAAATV